MKGWKRGRRVGAMSGLVLMVLAVLVAGCGTGGQQSGQEVAGDVAALTPVALASGEKLRVVATTNIVGDVVHQVGGDRIDLTVLMGIGVDPHSYVPDPGDTAAVHDAHVVLANGAGLEANLEEWLTGAGGSAIYVEVSDGLGLLPASGQEAGTPATEDPDHGDVDPHVWFSVPSVIHWVDRIEATLGALDPGNAAYYQGQAGTYRQGLQSLDDWIQAQVAQVPESSRKLVTNHPVFGYFARRYGFEQVGAVYPFNPSAEPSARQIAALEDAIRQYGVPAIFTESTVNPRLADQVAADTGIQVVSLYTGSLGGPGSGAESYLEMMRYDVGAIVAALKGG